MLLLLAPHSPLRIYLNVIITWYTFSDGLIYAKILEPFNFILDQRQCTNPFHLG